MPTKRKRKRRRNKGVESEIRRILYDLQKGYCFYCLKFTKFEYATGDHFVPKCKGGTNLFSNLVMACKGCNEKNGEKLYSEQYMSGRISFFNR